MSRCFRVGLCAEQGLFAGAVPLFGVSAPVSWGALPKGNANGRASFKKHGSRFARSYACAATVSLVVPGTQGDDRNTHTLVPTAGKPTGGCFNRRVLRTLKQKGSPPPLSAWLLASGRL